MSEPRCRGRPAEGLGSSEVTTSGHTYGSIKTNVRGKNTRYTKNLKHAFMLFSNIKQEVKKKTRLMEVGVYQQWSYGVTHCVSAHGRSY